MAAIANPIYDVVFKYLMEDNRIARYIIGKTIGREVLELIPSPQETSVEIAHHDRGFTVYRMDYSALIRDADGATAQVIIEIQKAKFAEDIIRFRRYLGQQYIKGAVSQPAAPIITIYFLGHKLTHATAPFIKVLRTSRDGFSDAEITEKESFIESLTHDSYIIQIPFLSNRRRSEFEIFLSVFDQDNIADDRHILNVNEDDFPEEQAVIIRRLQRAVAEAEVRTIMDLEDEILGTLKENERMLEAAEDKAEKESQRAEAEKSRAAEALALLEVEKHRAEAEKVRAEAAEERVAAEKHRNDELSLEYARLLKAQGCAPEEIINKSGLPAEVVSKL